MSSEHSLLLWRRICHYRTLNKRRVALLSLRQRIWFPSGFRFIRLLFFSSVRAIRKLRALIYEGGLKGFRPCLRENRDKQPLVRESGRSWCHFQTTSMIKLFWSQPICSMGIEGSLQAKWKVLGLAYNRCNKRPLGRDPDMSWCHRHTPTKLSWSQLMDWTAAHLYAAADVHGPRPKKL